MTASTIRQQSWRGLARVQARFASILRAPDVDEYERLVVAAAAIGGNAQVIVLLGGDAGLRGGEMRALEWTDVNLQKRQLRVERNDWRGEVTSTKGNRVRYVPLTRRLAEALKKHRHLRGARVLCRENGRPFAEHHLKDLLAKVGRRANVRSNGPHILRHTFCSHLTMKGAPARAIQELAGHRDLATTQRYMHLSPSAVIDAIRLLEGAQKFGDILETADQSAEENEWLASRSCKRASGPPSRQSSRNAMADTCVRIELDALPRILLSIKQSATQHGLPGSTGFDDSDANEGIVGAYFTC